MPCLTAGQLAFRSAPCSDMSQPCLSLLLWHCSERCTLMVSDARKVGSHDGLLCAWWCAACLARYGVSLWAASLGGDRLCGRRMHCCDIAAIAMGFCVVCQRGACDVRKVRSNQTWQFGQNKRNAFSFRTKTDRTHMQRTHHTIDVVCVCMPHVCSCADVYVSADCEAMRGWAPGWASARSCSGSSSL